MGMAPGIPQQYLVGPEEAPIPSLPNLPTPEHLGV